MRMRATAVAATGALALGALAVPAAHATEGGPYALDVTFSNTKINGGSTVAVGTTTPKKAAVTFTLKHGADVDIHASDFVVGVDLYRGASLDERTSTLESAEAACTDSATAPATVATCTATVTVDPADLRNADAGVWKTGLHAVAYNGQDRNDPRDPGRIGVAQRDSAKDFALQRFAKLTANASPEPVRKGRTITVTGLLSRASWDDGKYHGFSSSVYVKLEYRKKSETSYTPVQSTNAGTGGRVETTTTATADGSYRFTYLGNWITPMVSSPGDYVDVQ
ncbi:hypothetical protein EASAB2608_02994 [Streptomyces sp. EAS-AB2608]|uniref:Calcium-binding protein n=2 Tax=Streptomyces TaxID=1883 RepID=A0ABP5N6A5_9ACTN|nr:hypothetical protein EASAB2608_02994 [Streptomyces sp. EAS-AB2608]